jgi:hypothetical protein
MPALLGEHRLQQRSGRVADFLLIGLIPVERLVAGSVRLEVTDVAVELRQGTCGYKMHETQPVGKAPANILGTFDISVADDRIKPAGSHGSSRKTKGERPVTLARSSKFRSAQ